MIRILIPRHTYHEARIKLVERMTSLQVRNFTNVKRAYYFLEQANELFYEGFLENEDKLYVVGERLTDKPIYVKQEESWDETTLTWVIEDAEDLQGIPY